MAKTVKALHWQTLKLLRELPPLHEPWNELEKVCDVLDMVRSQFAEVEGFEAVVGELLEMIAKLRLAQSMIGECMGDDEEGRPAAIDMPL